MSRKRPYYNWQNCTAEICSRQYEGCSEYYLDNYINEVC